VHGFIIPTKRTLQLDGIFVDSRSRRPFKNSRLRWLFGSCRLGWPLYMFQSGVHLDYRLRDGGLRYGSNIIEIFGMHRFSAFESLFNWCITRCDWITRCGTNGSFVVQMLRRFP
jgi:hypothetical protein